MDNHTNKQQTIKIIMINNVIILNINYNIYLTIIKNI